MLEKNSLHHMYASICFWSSKILKEVISYHNLIGLRHDYIPFLGNEKLINANVHLIVIVSQLTSERGWIILKSTSEVVNLKFIHIIVNLKFTKAKTHIMVNLEFTRLKVHKLTWTIVISRRCAYWVLNIYWRIRKFFMNFNVACSHDKLVGPTNFGIGSLKIWKV